jgi:4-amino-4-deoxy-L-arabinose transferase-like glycosyltransferase
LLATTLSPHGAAPSFWSSPSASFDPAAGRRLAMLAILVWAAVTWFVVPHGIGASWRECDTQAIARNFLVDGFDPLRPRVDWRGDTDGAVECEFPLYELMIATALAAVGEAEWPGRLLSLLSMVMAALSLHRLLEWRTGPGAALAGLATFLVAGSSLLLATRVMPDALSLGLGLAGLCTFVRYLDSGRGGSLWLATAATIAAALQKPLALQLGLVWFGWALVLAPRRLRELRLWLAFGSILAVVAAWLWHGRSLHAETGLTFGVVSGGDTKFPAMAQLLQPKVWLQLGWTTLQHGASWYAVVAAAALVVRRRFDRTDAVWCGAVAAGLLVSLRYSYHHGMGPHYHAFAAAAGAWFVARAMALVPVRWLWWGLGVAVVLQGAWRLREEYRMRSFVIRVPMLEVAARVREVKQPAELVVVRATKPRLDPQWARRNNFEDPTFFYQAGLRGWVLPADGFDVAALTELHRRGARLVYDPNAHDAAPAVAAWLAQHGEVLVEQHGMRVVRLRATM